MNPLADLLDVRRDEIVRRWREHVTASVLPGTLPEPHLLNSLPVFLGELAKALRESSGEPIGEPLAARSDVASHHGSQRFKLGFDVATVVREYAILQDLLFEMAEESTAKIHARDHRLVSKYLLSGVADSVSQFAIERDEQLRGQAANHLGFLAHELRNPLASARLAVAALKRRGIFETSRPGHVLEQSLKRLGDLIDGALVQTRLRASRKLDLETMQLKSFLEELAAESFVGDDDRQLKLELQAAENISLKADRKVLYSALSNLFRNAMKFTHHGGTVHLRAKEGSGRVVVEVEDECGGLPDGQVEKMFDPYVQAGKDRSGFGLGLAIAKQAAEAHGGTIRVHNLPRKGCIFILDIPQTAAEA